MFLSTRLLGTSRIHSGNNSTDLTGVIQAGGESRRMGRDKALLEFQGEPLIWRPIRRMRQVTDTLIIITNQPQKYSFTDLPLFIDLLPGTGALGGLYTALRSVQTPLAALVACDMPFASPALIHEGLRLLEEDPELAVAIPESEHGLEPLHCVYRVRYCLPAVEAALERGERRMISWHYEVKVQNIKPERVSELDPTGLAFWNLNTPNDLAEAVKLASTLDEKQEP